VLILAAEVGARLALTPEPVLRGRRIARLPQEIAPEALDFTRLIRAGETLGWAEATAEPVFLTRLLDAQAARCAAFRVFFPLTFSNTLGAGHPQVTVTALGGASAGRRFFAGGADNVIPANISDLPGLIATGRLAIDIVLLQLSGPNAARRYNTGLGIEHLDAAIARARLVVAQHNPELPWTEGDTIVEAEAVETEIYGNCAVTDAHDPLDQRLHS
jgi:acyl-CoA hydrolase